jgi:hypothetical protein
MVMTISDLSASALKGDQREQDDASELHTSLLSEWPYTE